jgi:hypothetical protein
MTARGEMTAWEMGTAIAGALGQRGCWLLMCDGCWPVAVAAGGRRAPGGRLEKTVQVRPGCIFIIAS